MTVEKMDSIYLEIGTIEDLLYSGNLTHADFVRCLSRLVELSMVVLGDTRVLVSV